MAGDVVLRLSDIDICKDKRRNDFSSGGCQAASRLTKVLCLYNAPGLHTRGHFPGSVSSLI